MQVQQLNHNHNYVRTGTMKVKEYEIWREVFRKLWTMTCLIHLIYTSELSKRVVVIPILGKSAYKGIFQIYDKVDKDHMMITYLW